MNTLLKIPGTYTVKHGYVKKILLAIFIFTAATSRANTSSSPVDTIDFWHVYYNDTLIKQYNWYSSGQPLVFLRKNIKPGDHITVKYSRDTPCNDCDSYLIIEYPFFNKAVTAHGTYTFCPLTIALADLVKLDSTTTAPQLFNAYYQDAFNGRKVKLFELKIE